MNTKEVLTALITGKKIRRKEWRKNEFIFLNEAGVIEDDDGHDYCMSFRLHYEWELYLTAEERAYLKAIDDVNMQLQCVKASFLNIDQKDQYIFDRLFNAIEEIKKKGILDEQL